MGFGIMILYEIIHIFNQSIVYLYIKGLHGITIINNISNYAET